MVKTIMLKPCPWCGATQTRADATIAEEVDGNRVSVKCRCGADGPLAGDIDGADDWVTKRQKALRAWNTRAA